MGEDLAMQVAEAREDLGQKLLQVAAVLQQVAEVMQCASVELAEAALRESAATGEYIASLEKQISAQRAPS
jgi:hypothetical protein